MKTIKQLEEMMRAFAIEANQPQHNSVWEDQTIEFFPGLSVTISDDGEGYFQISLSLAGFSASASVRFEYGEATGRWSLGNPQSNWSLNDELERLSGDLRARIAKDSAERVRDEIKGILRI